MANSRLDVHFDGKDLGEASVSPTVTAALKDIYDLVSTHHFLAAAKRARSLLAEPMSVMQRIRVLYILGLMAIQYHPHSAEGDSAATEAERHNEADACIAEARGLAYEVGELAVYAHLTYLHARIQHERQRFGEAFIYFTVTLQAFQAQVEGLKNDHTLELDTLDWLSVEAFLIGRYTQAERFLAAAERLVRPRDDTLQRIANLSWTRTLLDRWQGRPHDALRDVLFAQAVFMTLGDQVSLARLSTVIADICLDFVVPLAAQTNANQRDWALAKAAPHLQRALNVPNAESDPSGRGLTLLTQSRYHQAMGDYTHALDTLVAVEATARRLSDWPLLAQTQTVRGSIFAAQGRDDAAHVCYSATLATLERSDALAYAQWARIGLS